jgi:hypothetical protein
LHLDKGIRENIRKDMAVVTEDETQTTNYRADLANIIDRVKQLNLDLPYIKRYNDEIIFVDKQKQVINRQNAKEKQEKLAITKGKFDKILEKQKDKYKDQTVEEYQESLYLTLAVSLTGIALLLCLFFIKIDSPVHIIALITIGICGYLGYRMGNNIAVYITRSLYDKNIIGAIIGMYAGVAGGCYARMYVPVINELLPYKVYEPISTGFLFLLAFLVLAAFGARAYMLMQKNNKAIEAVALPQKEQDALDENIKEIDRYFKEKEAFDLFQELARVVSIDDAQFDREFAKLKNV